MHAANILAFLCIIGVQSATLVARATDLDVPSLAAHWDATDLTSLGGVSALTDLSGNGWDLGFGATSPTLAVNQFGRSALNFSEGLTTSLATTSQGSATLFGDSTPAQPWAVALGLQYQGSRFDQALGEIAGDSGNSMSVRITNDEVDFQVRFPGGPPLAGIQNLPISEGSNVVIVVQHDGLQQSVEIITDESSWGSGVLGNSVPFMHRPNAITASPSGHFVLNESQAPINFYGAAYLDNPSAADVDALKVWGAREWLLQGRDSVVLFEGDSTVEVDNGFADRAPSWAEVLHDENFDQARTLSQNFANGGARAIANVQFQNGLADSPHAETWDYIVDWLSSAGADVYAPLVIGTNDIGGDDATPEQVIQAIEAWAQRTVAQGGKPIWVGILDTQGDPSGTGRTAVNEELRDRTLAGENSFVEVMDDLRTDPVWGWGNDVNQTGPQFMADNTHPNTAGNADIASKLAASFLALLATDGDFNLDGVVDQADLTDPFHGWLARFGQDLSGVDFLAWQRNLGASALSGVGTAVVPEPGGLMVLLELLLIASCDGRTFKALAPKSA